MRYSVVRLGARYPGRCVVCGGQTGTRQWELASTLLLRDAAGRFAVAHARCVGAIRSRVAGTPVYEGPQEIECR